MLGRDDVNHVLTRGGRLAARVDAGHGVRIDVGLIFQRIEGADSQYSTGDPTRLATWAAKPQPHNSEYLMPSITVRKDWGDVQLVSTTGWSRHRTAELFDLSRYLIGFKTRRRIAMLSHETRFSGDFGRARLVAGAAFLRDRTRLDSDLDDVHGIYGRLASNALGDIVDTSLFGEASLALGGGFSLMTGGRVTRQQEKRRTIFWDFDTPSQDSLKKSRWSVTPAASLSWKSDGGLLAFLAYREGFRANNSIPVSLEDGESGEIYSRPDRLRMIEMGSRFAPSPRFGLSASASYAIWSHVQVDRTTSMGGFITMNGGDARIWALDAALSWKPAASLAIEAALAFNNSPAFSGDGPSVEGGLLEPEALPQGRLPQVAHLGARGAVRYDMRLSPDRLLGLGAALRYHGAAAGEFGRGQPSYLDMGLEGRLSLRRFAVGVHVANLLDSRADRFALGNPFAIGTLGETQTTPLQPRTVTLGIDANF